MMRVVLRVFCVIAAAAGLAWCGLRPPWEYTYLRFRSETVTVAPGPAAPLWRPPAADPSVGGGYPGTPGVRVDTGRLYVEWAVILAAGAAALALTWLPPLPRLTTSPAGTVHS